MDLLIPDSGLLFWMTLVFIIVFIILWKVCTGLGQVHIHLYVETKQHVLLMTI